MRISSLARALFLNLIGLLCVSTALAQTDITTWQVDTKHTGVNANESVLSPAFVQTPGNFVPLFSEQVDGQVFAQPLYLSGTTSSLIPGGWADGKTHNNVVFVVTENATLYAFDADGDSNYQPHTGSSNPIWKLHLVPTNNTTAVPIPKEDVHAADDITPLFGNTATPVIDPKQGIIYVVSALKDTGTLPATHPYEQLLWAINLKSGLSVGNSPVTINPEFNGQFGGDTNTPCPANQPPNTQNQGCEMDNEPLPATPGRIPFYPLHSHLRSALTLDNFNGHNTVYLVYASHSDQTPYSGFVVGYDATTLQQTTAFTTTPDNTFEAGIWMGGASPAIDPALNKMYVITGNGGNWDAPTNSFSLGTNWPMSVLAFDTTPAGTVMINGQPELQVPFADTSVWFTPAQWNNFNDGDNDLGAGGPLLFDTQAPDGSTKQLLLGGGKLGIMFLLDRTNLGGIDTKDGAPPTNSNAPNFVTFENSNVVQQLNIAGLSTFNTPAFFNNHVYLSGGSFGALSFPVGFNSITNSYISTASEDASPEGSSGKNAGVFISANGTSNGLVWQNSNGLRAWDASNLRQGAIYKSGNVATDDAAQSSCQTPTFSLPIVSNGKAYFTCYQAPAQSGQFTTTNNGTTTTTLFSVPSDNRPGYLWVYGAPPVAAGAPTQVPLNVAAQADSDSEVTVTWSDPDFGSPTAHTGFTIFRATCAGCTPAQIATTQGQETTFADTGINDSLLTNPSALSPNTTYFYSVKATNLSGPSNASNIASATTFQQYSQPGLVAYWPMDEGVQQGINATGSVDLTGNGHTAVKTPPPANGTNEVESSSTGYIGGSWNFHGTTVMDRLVVSNSAALQFTAQQSFSLVAWVNPTVLNGFGIGTPPNEQGVDGASIIVKSRDQGSEYGLWINTSGQWEARSGTPGAQGTVITGPAATSGVWTQLALVQDGPNNKRYLYVNGQLAGQGTAQNANGGGDLWFGQQNLSDPNQQDGFQGNIDEVRIYNTVVTPAQLVSDFSDPVYLATSIQSHAGTPVGIQFFPFGPSGFPTTETRVAPNQTYTLQLNFAQPLSAAPAAVLNAQPGSTQLAQGSVQSVTLDSSGMIVTVTLANVPNAQALQLHLTGLTSGASLNGTYDLPFNVLEGDVSPDGVVNVADQEAITTLMTNSNGQVNPINQITPANAQFDLNLDGVVDGKDVSLVPSLFGAVLPLQADTNLALLKQTSASSFNGGNTAAMAVDNNLSTRWESTQGVDPQSLVIDLQNTANIHSIILDWENAAGANYVLQTSNDPTVFPEASTPDCSAANTKWTTVVNVTGNTNGGIKTYSGLNGNGRFVRMCGTTRTTQFGYSLFDFEVIGSFGAATPTPPVITSAPTATAIEGQAFSYAITSNEAGTTFTTSTLPTPLALNGAVISGTPAVTGRFPITLTAINSTGQTGTATLTLTVNAPTPVITSAPTATATVGQLFSYTIMSNPTASTFSTSTLPTPLALNGAVISGTPTASGSFPITLNATNSTGQTGTASLTLTINPAVVTPPAAPTNLTPTAVSSSQINLSWTASTTSGVTYSVFRSTTSGFTPSAANQIAQGLTTTTDSDTGLTASTTYFYVVEAVSGAESTPSLQASTETLAASGVTEVIAINAGSATAVPDSANNATFIADSDFTGGNDDVTNHAITIPTAIASIAAPAAVYADAHQGGVTYTIPNLSAGNTYTVVLHFAELFFTAPNSRLFNVSINGAQVLTNFDIFAAAGNASFTAAVETIPNITPVNGQIVIAFTNGTNDQPMVNGIELQTGGPAIPSAPTALTASTGGSSTVNLSWTPSVSSGVTYTVFRSTTAGFVPSAATQIANNLTTTSFSDTSLTPSTMFYYVVEAVNGAGVLSPPSQQVSTSTAAVSTDVIAINAGSSTVVGSFIGDTDFVGGNDDAPNKGITIPAAIASIAAPAAVYADAHQGGVIYTIPNLSATRTYTVVLHFAELFFTTANSRQFNVSINGTQVMTNFDIFAAAGNANFTATVQSFANITPVNGQIVIAFSNGAHDQPMVNGIEIK
ncbi:malectin domain-containing carbohydrate-binding protein [Tunturibacter psychrotolerans]|uniref:Malectin domain-containing carbohydrate-binding protein n=1 Tax=Tunturiibacter psychrotolerans TaxID=3069686 RepID=A0AAU7ZU88_9BACT